MKIVLYVNYKLNIKFYFVITKKSSYLCNARKNKDIINQ